MARRSVIHQCERSRHFKSRQITLRTDDGSPYLAKTAQSRHTSPQTCLRHNYLFFAVHREGMRRLFDAVAPAMNVSDSPLERLESMLLAHARALLEHHTYESVVVQGVHLHRYGALTPQERLTLDELIASRDTFDQVFKDQLTLLKQSGRLKDTSVSIAAKTLLGGLQWSLIWYRPEKDDTLRTRERLAREMVAVLMQGLAS